MKFASESRKSTEVFKGYRLLNMAIETSHKIFVLLIASSFISSCSTYQTSSLKMGSDGYRPQGNLSSGSSSKVSAAKEARALPSSPNQLFDWPVEDARLSRGFLPHGSRKRKKPHLGIDLAAPKGTPIFAAQTGTVIYTGKEFRGYGKLVMIENGNGWATLYAHLDKILVSEGQKVAQGEIIAAMGNTGRSTGSHLHFEIRRETGPIDPLPFLPTSQLVARGMSSVQELPTEHEDDAGEE